MRCVADRLFKETGKDALTFETKDQAAVDFQSTFGSDALNVLNNAAAEGVITDNLASANFGLPTSFVDPRRVMISVRMNLGR